MFVGSEENLLTVGREGRSKTRASEISDLLRVLSFAVRHEELHLHRRRQIFAQQFVIALLGFGRLRMIGAPHHLLAVARKYRAAVVTIGLGELLFVRSVRLHGP